MKQHMENCWAPICFQDETEGWEGDVTWYPGEPVCQFRGHPHRKAKRRQLRINRWVGQGKFRHLETYFTVKTLERGSQLYPGRRGMDPDIPNSKGIN